VPCSYNRTSEFICSASLTVSFLTRNKRSLSEERLDILCDLLVQNTMTCGLGLLSLYEVRIICGVWNGYIAVHMSHLWMLCCLEYSRNMIYGLQYEWAKLVTTRSCWKAKIWDIKREPDSSPVWCQRSERTSRIWVPGSSDFRPLNKLQSSSTEYSH
jgi:hypothetical protein